MSVPYTPVSAEDLARLHQLGRAEHGLMQQLYDLELARIPIIAAGKRIREEQDSVYRRIATERGLPAQTLLKVNMETGEVRVMGGASEETAPAPRAAEPQAEARSKQPEPEAPVAEPPG